MKTPLLSVALSSTILLSPTLAQDATEPRPWTFMIYGAADNNADGPILEFLDRVRKAWDDDPGMELVLFLDRSEGFSDDAKLLGANFTGARIYRLRRDKCELLDASAFFPKMKPGEECELDSADPKNLGKFIAFCKDRYPARRYGLMIYSHANGAVMCPDDQSGRDMAIPQLAREVGPDGSVDFLGLELCNMAGLEIAYEWRPGNGGFSAKVLVAIPNAGIPLDWDRAFARIRSKGHTTSAPGKVLDPRTMTARDFGRLIVEEGAAGRQALLDKYVNSGKLNLKNPRHRERCREAAGCFDLSKCAAAKRAVDRLATALASAGAKDVVGELRGSSDGELILNFARRGQFRSRPYVDAFELLHKISECEKLSADVRTAARSARDAVDEVVLESFGSEAGFGRFRAGKNGLFLVFPDGDATVSSLDGSERSAWTNLAWYTPLGPKGMRSHYGRWSFLRNGATAGNGKVENWFELLDSWFDKTDKSSGGTNGYRW